MLVGLLPERVNQYSYLPACLLRLAQPRGVVVEERLTGVITETQITTGNLTLNIGNRRGHNCAVPNEVKFQNSGHCPAFESGVYQIATCNWAQT